MCRDGHIVDSENSENKGFLNHFLKGKEFSDGAGNMRNRKISSRRFSSLVLFISQLKKFVTPELRKVGHFAKNCLFSLWDEIFESNINFLVHPPVTAATGRHLCARLISELRDSRTF